MINSNKRYTLVISTMSPGDLMQGKIYIGCEKQIQIQALKDEATEMKSYAMLVGAGMNKLGSFYIRKHWRLIPVSLLCCIQSYVRYQD